MDESFSEAATKPYVLLLLSGVVLVILFVYYRICYAPYQVFKEMGVEGPNPRLFIGNIMEYKKMVGSCNIVIIAWLLCIS